MGPYSIDHLGWGNYSGFFYPLRTMNLVNFISISGSNLFIATFFYMSEMIFHLNLDGINYNHLFKINQTHNILPIVTKLNNRQAPAFWGSNQGVLFQS